MTHSPTHAHGNILIIEDDHLLGDLLQRKLQHAGFETDVVQYAHIARSRLQQERYDLVILDILLPDMDGLSFLKEMRSHDWGTNAQVLVLTNMNNTEHIMETLELGEVHEPSRGDERTFNHTARQGILTYFETRLKHGLCDFLTKTDHDLNDIVAIIQQRCEERQALALS